MFDPYHKWLGIPPKDQPPNHYRLLGIDLFETDSDVIDAAANKQMAYIQGCATGPHVALSQKLLNEIAAARLCLLTPAKKTSYDSDLKVKLAPPPTPAAAGAMPAPAVGPMSIPIGYFPPPGGVMPPGYPAPQPLANGPDDLALLPPTTSEEKKPARRRAPERGKNSAAPLVLIALGLVILVVAIVALVALGVFDSKPEKSKPTVPDRPAAPAKEKPKKSDPKAHP